MMCIDKQDETFKDLVIRGNFFTTKYSFISLLYYPCKNELADNLYFNSNNTNFTSDIVCAS